MRIAVVVLCLLFCAAPARAATQHRPIIGISLEGRYDDDALIGQADLWTKLSPEVGYRLHGETRHLEATYAVDVIHMLRARKMGVDHRVALAYRERLTERLTLKADSGVFRVQDTSSLPRLGVARVRAAVLWAKSDALLSYALSSRSGVDLGYQNEITRIILPEAPTGVVHAPFVLLRHRFTRRLDLGARYRFQLFADGLSPIADAHAATGFVHFQLSRHAFASLEAGPIRFQQDGQPFWGPRLHGELGYAARGVELGLSGGRDFLGAAGFANAIWADYLQLAAGWRISAPVSLFAAGGLFRNGVAPEQPVNAQGYGLSAGLEWRFYRGASLHIAWDRIAQIGAPVAIAGSEDVGLGLSRNIFSTRVGYRIP